MPEVFLSLPRQARAEILLGAEGEGDASAPVLEKDVWVCWCLKTLFGMPNRLPMVFKGGTSLSKVFGAINRFSEDIDITIDFRQMARGVKGPDGSLSSKARTTLVNLMRADVISYVKDCVAPYFEEQVKLQFPGQKVIVRVEADGEELHIAYESAFTTSNPYVKEEVKLEFGGRNSVDPSISHLVVAELSKYVTKYELPSAQIDVLVAVRTFWEKATLAHSESNKAVMSSAERLSRHWYDLYVLSMGTVGADAIDRIDILADVVLYKNSFYYLAAAKYPECLTGQLRLIPNEIGLTDLESDYLAMVEAGFIFDQPPSFSEIVEHLARLERELNEKILKWSQSRIE